MDKTTTPLSTSDKNNAPMPGPRNSTLMLLRQIARTYAMPTTATKNSALVLN